MDPARWQRLERLFHQALELEPGDRAAFLARACPDDEALRAEVQALLDSPASAHGLLDPSSGAGMSGGESGAGEDLTGRRIGAYEVQELIGAGGMGEVYRARDTALGRDVALKTLPRALATDPDRVARLRQEARTLASLSHPHIATLYGYETDGATTVLVMELVAGETLEARLRRGALPLDQALEIAGQIAGALDRAHRHGVVHRDLKPANVMLTRDGVKVLDFGLAKPYAPSAVDSEAPTLTSPVTQPGLLVGTLPYMAPEQLRGQKADARTDVFALGAVLYEMVTGRRPFQGASHADLMAAVLAGKPPPLRRLAPDAPPSLEWLVERCLAVDPDERWQSAHDVGLELRRIAEVGRERMPAGSGEAPTHATARTGLSRRGLGWVAALVLAVALAAVLLFRGGPEAPAEAETLQPVRRQVIDPGFPVVDRVTLSPDGTTLAYTAGNAVRELDVYVQPLSNLEATRVEGTRAAAMVAFSPDGRSLAFTAGGDLQNLYTIPLAGGRPELLVSGVLPWTVAWEEDGFIYYTADDQLRRVPERGGEPQRIDVGDLGRQAQADAQLLPDGRTLLFQAITFAAPIEEGRDVAFVDLIGGERGSLSLAGILPRFVPPRFLLFSRSLVIYAVPFEAVRRQVAGVARAIEFDVERSPRYVVPIASFGISRSGDLAFVHRESAEAKELVWVDKEGRASLLTEDRRDYSLPRVSPDGATLAVSVLEGPDRPALWTLDLATGAWQKPVPPLGEQGDDQTCGPCGSSSGTWTYDSEYLTFPSNRDGPVNLYHQPADFSRPAERIVPGPGGQIPADWSPDGRYLLYGDTRKPGLWVYDRETGNVTAPDDGEPYVRGVRFHPSGRWIAYTTHPVDYRSTEPTHIWIRPFPGPGAPRQVGAERGYGPEWSADGDELYFHGDTRIMAVAVEERGDQLVTGQAVPLFEDVYVRHTTAGIGSFAVHPDGRFLMVREWRGTPGPRIVIVQNVRTRLEELFPFE